MAGIDVKTVGALIDELSILNVRIWLMVDAIVAGTDNDTVANIAKQVTRLNARRTALIRAIDDRLGEGEFSTLEKKHG